MAPNQKKKSQTSRSKYRFDADEENIGEDSQRRLSNKSIERQQSESENEYDSSDSKDSSDTDGSSDESAEDEYADKERATGFEPSSDQSIYKPGRGEARIDELWATNGKTLELEPDAHNEVIGANAAIFATQLGIMTRDGNKLPLTYHDWRLIPDTTKERIWTEVQTKTNLPPTYKTTCLKRVCKLWRDWKSNVKTTYFSPYRKNTKVLLKNCPKRVDEDQWPLLVDYWSKEEVKNRSKVNRRSRKKQTMPHRTGRKGFANLRVELTRKIGTEPSKLDVFISPRQPKEGKSLDETTAKTIDMAKELTENLSESDKNDINVKDQTYHSLLGPEKPGNRRTHGVGARTLQVSNTPFAMSPEWTKALDDAITGRFEKFSNDLQVELEVKLSDIISDIIERKLSALLNKNTNMPAVNISQSEDQVVERTNVRAMNSDNVGYETRDRAPNQANFTENKDVASLSMEGLHENAHHAQFNSNAENDVFNAYSGSKRPSNYSIPEEVQEQMQDKSVKKKRKENGGI